MKNKTFFAQIERFRAPSTILFRSVELKLLKQRLSKILKSQPILDLGCGEGITASVVFEQKVDYGLDNDPYFLQKAKRSGLYKKTLLADAGKIPLENESIQLVFSNCVVEHMKQLNSTLSEIIRVLKKGGYFIFTAPSHNFKNYSLFSFLGLAKLARIYGTARERKLAHYHCYSLEKWLQVLKRQGFRLVEGYYYIDKQTAEFWDFLFILHKLFSFLEFVSPKLSTWAYKTFLRKQVYKRFVNSRTTDRNGTAVCLLAQKI